MNTANYTDLPRYPLSIESLDFIQEQIKLIYNICELYGKNYILRQPTIDEEGILIKNGEVLPIEKINNAGVYGKYIAIDTKSEDVKAGDENHTKVRTIRTARYTSLDKGNEWKEASEFEVITSISDMNKNIKGIENSLETVEKDLRAHLMPKGSIIMWSGTADEKSEEFPKGFKICDGRTIKINNVEISLPDLRGRFIVGYDSGDNKTPLSAGKLESNYGAIGNTGGEDCVKLTENELPSHNHISSDSHFDKLSAKSSDFTAPEPDYANNTYTGSNGANDGSKYRVGGMSNLWYKATIQSVGGNQQHENRPSYYVLAYLIKII